MQCPQNWKLVNDMCNDLPLVTSFAGLLAVLQNVYEKQIAVWKEFRNIFKEYRVT